MIATAVVLNIFYFSSPWAMLQVSLCRGLLTMVCPAVCPSVTFHIFDISIRIVFMIAASWKYSIVICSRTVSDRAETWWKASRQHGYLELLKCFRSDIQDGQHGSHLENLQIKPAPECLIELKLDGRHSGVMEIQLKSFCSNIQLGRHLEIL